MQKKILFLSIFCIVQLDAEDIIVKQKPKKESINKMKEQLASDFEDLITLSTHSIKYLSELIDDTVVHVKQLAGQQDGALVNPDKKTVELYHQKVCQLKKMLQDLDGQCSLVLRS